MFKLRFAFTLVSLLLWSSSIGLSVYLGSQLSCPETLTFLSGSNIYFMDMNRGLQVNATRQPGGEVAFSWSPDGELLAFESNRNGDYDIYLMDFGGEEIVNLTQNVFHDRSPVWSPDGTQIAFITDRDGNYEIYVMSADGSDFYNLSQHSSNDQTPVWSLDGGRIAFSSMRSGSNEYYDIPVSGGNVQRLTDEEFLEYYGAHSPNGELAFVSDLGEIFIRDSNGVERRLIYNSGNNFQPDWSPDGSRIAFVRGQSGGPEIFVVNSDGSNLRQITHNTYILDFAPQWRPCS